MIPKWPSRALDAIVALFKDLQDIDVYVEDEGSEPFYTELVKKIAPEGVRVTRIFALGGRTAVLTHAAHHDHTKRRALYLIDGDFEWVRGDPPPTTAGVYRLDAYCIENLLVSESAITQVLMECEACSEDSARTKLEFSAWANKAAVLIDLFIVWAAQNAIDPQLPTTSLGLGSCLTGAAAAIDPAKVRALRDECAARLSARMEFRKLLERISSRVKDLPFPLDVVSGKNFLFPALHMHLTARTRERPRRKSLQFRLARHADLSRFEGLTSALHRTARGA